MRPPSRLLTIGQAILDALVDHYAEMEVELPERRYLSAGMPAWDCEGVAVWGERSFSHNGDVSREVVEPLIGAVGSLTRGVQWGVTIMRCSPQTIEMDSGVVQWPTPDEETAAAALVLADEVMVPNALKAASRAGRFASTNDWAVAEWRTIGPAGGFVASEHRVRTTTDWTPPVEGS